MNTLFATWTPIIWGLLLSGIGGIGGYVFGHRKLKADAASVELENIDHAIRIWRSLAEDLSGKVTELMENITELRDENVALKSQIKSLEQTLHEIKIQQN